MPDAEISRRTLLHYQHNAEAFRQGTRSHDVSQNIDAMLRHALASPCAKPPLRILDFGCGPGRDLLTLSALGHVAVGLDGCAGFVDMARTASGCLVLEQDFLALDLPPASFDAVFANASLFHVPRAEITRVLGELHVALKPSGVLFSSNPRGNDEEGWAGERYGVWYRDATWLALVASCGYAELEHYHRPPNLPRDQQSWLASVWRKMDAKERGK